eukprot:8338320-Heterocapsa_arctica.AAC.1
MDTSLNEQSESRRELEAGDEQTKISDFVTEKMHVIGLERSTMSIDKISLVLRDQRSHTSTLGRTGYVIEP